MFTWRNYSNQKEFQSVFKYNFVEITPANTAHNYHHSSKIERNVNISDRVHNRPPV